MSRISCSFLASGLWCVLNTTLAQSYLPDSKAGMSAYLNFASYQTASGKSYFETYLSFSAATIRFRNDGSGKFQGKVHVTVSFFQPACAGTDGQDSELYEGTYSVLSPLCNDTAKRTDFIDVQRYWLKQGKYNLVIRLRDEYNQTARTISVKQPIRVGYPNDSICIADAEFLQSYTPSELEGSRFKGGYELIPYIFDYYPQPIDKISFYTEFYNTHRIAGQGKPILLRYYLGSTGKDSILKEYAGSRVATADTVIPLLGGVMIDELPTGNYRLTVEAVFGKEVIASRKFDFTRNNVVKFSTAPAENFAMSIQNKDTLIGYIHCLLPISTAANRDFISSDSLKGISMNNLQAFFYGFWKSRNPSGPEGAWKKYYGRVKEAETEFAAMNTKGYQTDRGRVFLQYGPPNQRVISKINPMTLPYEIWEYYKLPDGQVDRKFVFYEPDPVSNNYVLLHSNAIGETHNRQWQLELYSIVGQPSNVDQNKTTDPIGENALDEFNNPR